MYNEIAQLYHLVYPDWDHAIAKQSQAYYETAAALLGSAPHRVLDVSCGIGTQALGLAKLGCDVVASDLSSGAVERAKSEAAKRGLKISFCTADMAECYATHGGGFDCLISADNSLPHLDESRIRAALEQMQQCLKPRGCALIGIRDYQPDEERTTGQVFSYGTREFGDHRYVVFQTRDWSENTYEVGMYFVQEQTDQSESKVISGKSVYHAITVDKVMELMGAAGFSEVRRHDGVTHNVLLSGHAN